VAHLWVKNQSDRWCVLPLESEAYSLVSSPPKPLNMSEDHVAVSSAYLLSSGGDQPAWVVISNEPGFVSVNGEPLTIGIRTITDLDEIRVRNAGTVFFSTESLPAAEKFVAADRPIFCPRCKQAIEHGDEAVKCPGCGVWHHQTPELGCWTYAPTCALCSRSSDLTAGFQWTPEEL